MIYTEQEEPGYDFAFAPVHPIDPEYRQAYSDAQKQWLALWCPKEGAWPQ